MSREEHRIAAAKRIMEIADRSVRFLELGIRDPEQRPNLSLAECRAELDIWKKIQKLVDREVRKASASDGES